MGYSSVNAGKPARIVPVGLPACMLIRSLSHPHLGPPNPGPGPSPGPSASALELVVLQQAPTNDHPLDLRSALADEQHGSLAVEPLDLVLLGVAVATPRSTRSSGSTARLPCCSSARALRRSSG